MKSRRTTAGSSSAGADRIKVDVSVSVRTILLVTVAAAIAWALASIANVLLVILVSVFSVAVLSPVVTAMERRFGWSRGLCSTLVVLMIVLVIGAVGLVLAQATGGVAHVGVSAFGAVTLVFSVVFLTLYGLIDERRARDWVGGLLYRDDRERYVQVTDRIVRATSRYMLGNLAISVVCGTVYGITAVILALPYPLALAVIAGILDLVPNVGATIAGVVIALVALSVSLEAMIVFLIVIVVYQQIENYALQPTIIGKAAQLSGFAVLASVLAFGALFGLIGAIIGVPIAAGLQIVAEELTANRRARIAAADVAERQQPA